MRHITSGLLKEGEGEVMERERKWRSRCREELKGMVGGGGRESEVGERLGLASINTSTELTHLLKVLFLTILRL